MHRYRALKALQFELLVKRFPLVLKELFGKNLPDVETTFASLIIRTAQADRDKLIERLEQENKE